MDSILLDAFAIFLPAGIANMTPVLANKIPLLNQWDTPIDFGKSLKNIRIFGDHKTWRGLLTGTLLGTIWSVIWFYGIGDHTFAYAFLLGITLSAGALFGDAIKSFFKRRVGVASGKSWFPFDQTDYIFGGLVLSAPILQPTLALVVAIFGIYFGLHIVITYVGFLCGFKKDPI